MAGGMVSIIGIVFRSLAFIERIDLNRLPVRKRDYDECRELGAMPEMF